MKRKFLPLLAPALLCAGFANAQCEAVSTIKEDFETFTKFPDNCWSVSAATPYFSLGTDDIKGNGISFYSLFKTKDTFFVISPEVSSIDGQHSLSFDAIRKGGEGEVIIQIGTLSKADDYTSFTPFEEPFKLDVKSEWSTFAAKNIASIKDHKYIGIRIISSNAHQNLLIDNINWDKTPCEAITTLNENFNTFTAFPDNCWTVSHAAPVFSLSGKDGENSVQFYSFMSAKEDYYLITPEFSTIPAKKVVQLDLTAGGSPGDISIQLGSLSDIKDYASFKAIGKAIKITSDQTTYTTDEITTSNGHLAFKIIPSATHQAVFIDNISLVDAPKDIEPPTNIDGHNQTNIAVYPNPVQDKLMIQSLHNINQVIVYDITSKEVLKTQANSNYITINTADWNNGVYWLQITLNNNQSQSFKIVK